MTAEWGALDGAEVRLRLDPATGGLEWFVVIPRDDGTLAAGITSMRLTYPEDRPISIDGKDRPVARLGRSGIPLACQDGSIVVVAGSRYGLEQGMAMASKANGGPVADDATKTGLNSKLDSGTVFRLEPGRIPILPNTPLPQRRMIEALRAIGGRRVEGTAFLQGGTLVLDVTIVLEGSRRVAPEHPHPGVDPAWLEGLPSAGIMGMFSMAIDSRPDSWDWAFAAVDRVERLDPARAGVLPLRSRLNLMLAAVGVKLEADLHLHLRGLSGCLIGDPDRPGRPTGAILVLHLDDHSTAQRLVRESSPRLGTLLRATPPDGLAVGDRPAADRQKDVPPEAPHMLGNVSGRPVTVRARGRDIWLAWGDGVPAVVTDEPLDRRRSLAAACGGWAAEGWPAPGRVVAVWPGRLWRPAAHPGLTPAALRALADDPPVVWWGWSDPVGEHDLIRWGGLRRRVREFLDGLPAIPGPMP